MLNELLILKRKMKYHHKAIIALEADLDQVIETTKKQGYEKSSSQFERDVNQLVEIVKLNYGISKADLMSPKRHQAIVDARCIVYQILRNAGYTYAAIGQAFSNRDHSTITHASKKFKDLQYDKAFTDKYNKINQLFNN